MGYEHVYAVCERQSQCNCPIASLLLQSPNIAQSIFVDQGGFRKAKRAVTETQVPKDVK
jgi:hypothetical protein